MRPTLMHLTPWMFDVQRAVRRMQKKLLQTINASKLELKINTAVHPISRSIVILTESRPAAYDDFTDEDWMTLRRRLDDQRLKMDDAL
ncbi:hypothetical protein HDU86_007515 [Geranomyces michiganensis]|nr:hypothetical protein HDU86_007515 [Geranomyces michiganensis]